VDRAHLHAIHVFTFDAVLHNYICHQLSLFRDVVQSLAVTRFRPIWQSSASNYLRPRAPGSRVQDLYPMPSKLPMQESRRDAGTDGRGGQLCGKIAYLPSRSFDHLAHVLRSRIEGTWRVAARPGEQTAQMTERRSSFSYEDLLACGRGELFGAGNAQLPLPPMLMFDRIREISETSGASGKGGVRAEFDIRPTLWFFDCHFKGDPVMPGCLGLDALWQLTGFFLGWLGLPGRGRALGV